MKKETVWCWERFCEEQNLQTKQRISWEKFTISILRPVKNHTTENSRIFLQSLSWNRQSSFVRFRIVQLLWEIILIFFVIKEPQSNEVRISAQRNGSLSDMRTTLVRLPLGKLSVICLEYNTTAGQHMQDTVIRVTRNNRRIDCCVQFI